jgi:hypothetical protein
VVDDEYDDCSDDRYKHAVDVQAGYGRRAEEAEQEATHYRPDDPEDNIENQPFAALVDDFARDEAGDEAQDQPADDRHVGLFLKGGVGTRPRDAGRPGRGAKPPSHAPLIAAAPPVNAEGALKASSVIVAEAATQGG